MKKHLKWSNVIFVMVIFLFFYKPTRIWFIGKFSFSPSVKKVEESLKITDYNWQLSGMNTSDMNFSDLKGKVIFINFWATWCPPCVAEMPSIQNFYNDYKDKVAFVFVTNDDWKLVDAFYKEHQYDLPVYQSVSEYLKELPSVNSIPRTFVVDKKGNVRVDKSGSAKWNSEKFRKQIDSFLQE